MNVIRLFFVAALLLLAVSCGKKESKSKAQQKNVAKTAVEQTQRSDALFNEFFDESSSDTASVSSGSSQNTVSSSSFNISEVRFSPTGRYVVQISTVASPDLAKSIASKLEQKGYPVYVADVQNPTTELIGHYYRVRIGGFDGISEAKYFGENILRSLGYDYWVDNKSNDNLGISGTGLGSYYPHAVDYDAQPAVKSHENRSFNVEPEPAAPAAGQPQSAEENNWENFEW